MHETQYVIGVTNEIGFAGIFYILNADNVRAWIATESIYSFYFGVFFFIWILSRERKRVDLCYGKFLVYCVHKMVCASFTFISLFFIHCLNRVRVCVHKKILLSFAYFSSENSVTNHKWWIKNIYIRIVSFSVYVATRFHGNCIVPAKMRSQSAKWCHR